MPGCRSRRSTQDWPGPDGRSEPPSTSSLRNRNGPERIAMNAREFESIDRCLDASLTAAGRDAPSPEEGFLDRLAEQSLETFLAAPAEPPRQLWRRIMHSKSFRWT